MNTLNSCDQNHNNNLEQKVEQLMNTVYILFIYNNNLLYIKDVLLLDLYHASLNI